MEDNKTSSRKIRELFDAVAKVAKQSAERDLENGQGLTSGTVTAIEKTIDLYKQL